MGLSPQYYDGCTDDVLNLYAELEDRIIADVVRRIVKTGNITETAKWQLRQAQQMGLLYDDIIKDIAKYTNKTDIEIKKMFENAGVETVNNDNRLHIQAGKSPLDIRQSESMLQILNGVYKNSLTDLKNLTGTTAITSQTAYYNACNSAFMMVSSGAFSYQQALRTVIQEVGQNGATVSYPSGHTDKLDVAVRRSLLTGIGLASRQISEENSRLCGCDLMEISAHSGARPSHAVWQGQIVSLSGRRGYLSKSDIGYGTGAGFGGWNCRHDWYPFYEGISKRNYSQKDLDKLNAKDIKYNGKMYSEYEISQMLRQKEREIRALKREAVAYDTAIKQKDDEELKSKLKDDFTKTSKKLKDKEQSLADFTKETGIKRDRFREQVQGFNRSVSSKSTWADKKSRNDLTSAQNSGNISERENTNLKEFGVLYGESSLNVDSSQVFKDSLKNKISFATNNNKANQSLQRCVDKMLLHRSGTLYEDMYVINYKTGYILGKQTSSKCPQGVIYNDSLKNAFKKSKDENIPIITVHNHPEGYPPSVDDFNSALKNNTVCGFAIGHNGQVYKYYKPKKMFSKKEIQEIHNEIAYNYSVLGMDVDRAYGSVFKENGLRCELIGEDGIKSIGWEENQNE